MLLVPPKVNGLFHSRRFVDAYLVPGKEHFIHHVIHLVHDLGKKIIVEGVETQEQAIKRKELDADIIQGYYYSKPLPPDEAIRFPVSQCQND